MARRRCLSSAILIVFIAVLPLSLGVDRKKFRTCDQTSFCQRHRNQPELEHQAEYKIVRNSIKPSYDGTSFTADLELSDSRYAAFNVAPPKPLVLQVDLLVNDVARLRIRERDPLHPRYEITDPHVLTDSGQRPSDSVQAGFKLDERANMIQATFGGDTNYLLALQTAPLPFKANLYVGKELALSVNADNLFKFEQYRTRPEKVADGDKECELDDNGVCVGDDQARAVEVFPPDSDDMWKERFDGKDIHNKNGPASIGMDVTFVGARHVFGIPEHASSFSLKTTRTAPGKGDTTPTQANKDDNNPDAGYDEPYRLYNLDVFEYELDEPMALYGAIPFMMSHDPNKSAAVLWLNAAETFVDIYDSNSQGSPSKTSHWISETGIVDLFLFGGPTPARVHEQYAGVTGMPAMPPRFGIAYHQCRWNYRDEADVDEVDAKFDEHNIPYDVLWLDIEHTDGKRYFTWDSQKFPNPKAMQQRLADKFRKMVIIIDPHIKKDDNYFLDKEGLAKDLFVKDKDGKVYEGWCWPGSVHYLDFCEQTVSEYWASLFAFSKHTDATPSLFVWNDMNEPSVFNGPEVTMPKDNVHQNKWEHRDVHNIYGALFQAATYDGLLKRSNGAVRPFVLSRSFFAGSQRVGAVWTGDNTAEWGHLEATVPMLLSHSIAGLPFIGADVGGFFKDPEPELLLRWYQGAAFQPFFRAHAHIDTKRREPWVNGEPWTSHYREAIRQRYIYLPYLYTIFHETHVTGQPVIRPLWYEHPADKAAFAIEDQFLLGKDLLIKPITAVGVTETTVYLPGAKTEWVDTKTFARYAGGKTHTVAAPLDDLPVFQRAGSIIPRKEIVRRSSDLMADDPFTLYIHVDQEGNANGQLFEDDGISYDYTKGKYIHREFTFSNNILKSTSLHPSKSTFDTVAKIERLVITHSVPRSISSVKLRGSAEQLRFSVDPNVKNTLIVKQPGVGVGDDFEIEFS